MILLLVLAGSATRGAAVDTQAIRDDDFSQLTRGELRSVASTSDGYLMPTYARSTVGNTGSEIVWDALRDGRRGVLAATGHHGRLVRLRDDQTTESVAELPEPELTALLRLRDGALLVAAAPSGRIYRLAADDTLTTWCQVEASFIWRMVQDASGAVWVATGTDGKLYRVTERRGAAVVEEIHDFQSANLLDLWIDEEGKLGPRGRIYVAAQNPGWLYRLDPASKKAEVVFNSGAEEVRAILPMDNGLALALNTERAPTPQALQLTLRMAGGQVSQTQGARGGGNGAPGGASGGGEQRALNQALAGTRGGNFGPPRSTLVLLEPTGYARPLWSAPERPIASLGRSPGGGILAAVGEEGRVFEVQNDGNFAVVADVREDYVVRLAPDGDGFLLANARNGVVYRMGRQRAREAVFISRPIDAETPARWGKFYFSGSIGRGQSVQVAFRSGNDGDADSDLWSEWTRDARVENQEAVQLPEGPARFIQYRLTMRQGADDAESVRMDYVDLFYRAMNSAPLILALDIQEAGASGARGAAGAGPSGARGAAPPAQPSGGGRGGAGSSGDEGERPSSGRTANTNAMNFNVTWRIMDPNTDALVYALYYRASDETQWKLIDDDLHETRLPLDVSGIADGRYRLKLVVSDQPGNPPGEGLKTEKISDEFVVDNTPPRFVRVRAGADGRRARIDLIVEDDLSLISAVKMDLDNGDSLPLFPNDGLLDDRREEFTITTPEFEPGEHVATIVATDRKGNTTVTKAVFTIR